MKIVAEFNFNNGKDVIEQNFINEFNEIKRAISNINAELYKTKKKQRKNNAWENVIFPKEIK